MFRLADHPNMIIDVYWSLKQQNSNKNKLCSCILRFDYCLSCDIEVVIVVVALLFYVHGKHLRSCRDGQLT